MGNVRANRHGFLYFDFMFRGIRCREGTKLRDMPKNRRSIAARMQIIDEQIKVGTFDYVATFPQGRKVHIFAPLHRVHETFREYYLKWLRDKYDPDREINDIKYSTYRDYRDIGNTLLIPHFGNMELRNIETVHLKEFSRKLKGLSATRVRHVIAPLRACLNEAMDLGMIEINPWKKNLFGKLRVDKKEINPFSIDEIQVFLEKCPPWFREFYVVAFYTGMRPSEQIALKWSRVDFRHRSFRIMESRAYGREGVPKTRRSVRDVAMSPAVYEAFLAQKEKTFGVSKYVFVGAEGKALLLHNMRKRVWAPTLIAAELSYRNPYQTRHTAITLMLMSGEDPYWVAEQTGTSPEMIFKHYFKYIKSMSRQDGKYFERFLEKQKTIRT